MARLIKPKEIRGRISFYRIRTGTDIMTVRKTAMSPDARIRKARNSSMTGRT
jgi:hypothetical protein